MGKAKGKPYPKFVKDIMAEKTLILSKAQALSDMGLAETVGPLWVAAASHEERIAPLLDSLGREEEAAVHRISAASCFQKAREFSRAANLFRAALAGPLQPDTRQQVEQMLAECLRQLSRVAV